MSEEAPIGLTIMEKLMGLIIILIGAITFYVTYTNMASTGPLLTFFLAVGLVLVVLGIVIVIVKAE